MIVLDGVKTKCHIEAFNNIGVMPVKHIRYDNVTSAVTAVVFGQSRQRLRRAGTSVRVHSLSLAKHGSPQ